MKHLTTDELVNLVYGVGPGGHLDGHLDDCRDCSERFQELLREKRAMAESLPVSHEFLAAQRRNIYARMGERPQARLKWVPAMAAAVCLIAVGVFSGAGGEAGSSGCAIIRRCILDGAIDGADCGAADSRAV
jgi:hypothetical protein